MSSHSSLRARKNEQPRNREETQMIFKDNDGRAGELIETNSPMLNLDEKRG